VSAKNRREFAHDHEKYMPQFGGCCAKAVSENRIAKAKKNWPGLRAPE